MYSRDIVAEIHSLIFEIMISEKSKVRGLLCYAMLIASIVAIIQCAVFISTKGDIMPSITVDISNTVTRCRRPGLFLWNYGKFESRLRTEYEDGYIEYGGINLPFYPNRGFGGMERVCTEVLALSGWFTAHCSEVEGGNLCTLVYRIEHGILLFEFLFSFSLVADILILVADISIMLSRQCILVIPGIISLTISAIGIVVNATHPDRIYGSALLLLLVSVVRFIWLSAVGIYHCMKAEQRGELIPLNQASPAA
jgi:hypothetical protein